MNREIKFRGLRIDGKGFVFGFYCNIQDKKHYILEPCALGLALTEVTPESVGQYTGLKDKNGIKIYEGDLLSDPYPIDEEDLSKGYHESQLPVIWCNKELRWSVDTSFAKDGTHLAALVEYFGDELEVKGNVYEKRDKE